jgi:hypothetical protein
MYAAPVEGKANKHWWIVFSIAFIAFLWGLGCIVTLCLQELNLGIKQNSWLGGISLTSFGGLVLVTLER